MSQRRALPARLNLLIAGSGIALLMLTVFLFS
jgi:hypothetical protein